MSRPFQGLFRNRPPAGFPASRASALSAQLVSEKEALAAFSASLEEEFLELGGLLRKISAFARDVRDLSGEVISQASGQTEDAAVHFAFQLLKKAEDLVQASRDQYNGVLAVFETIHADLKRIGRKRGALVRVLFPLRTVNTQFRIQACSFDDATREKFFVLADSIGVLVGDVEAAIGQRFEGLERTGATTRDSAIRLSALAHEQEREAARMLAETRSNLGALSKALASSEAAAQSLSDAGARLAAGVGRVIVALQCQDSARQKVQHIGEAIDEMAVRLAPACSSSCGRDAQTDCLRYLAGAGRVQLAQVRGVFDDLNAAAESVTQGLTEVETEAGAFAGCAMRAGGATLDGQITARSIHSIHEVLAVMEGAIGNVRSVAALVEGLKATFSDCTSEILGLAMRLRMVALNAQVFAAHVEEGTALEVVAANTRRIADEAMQQLEGISSHVEELVDSVVDLEQRLGDYHELAAVEQAHLKAEAGQSEAKLTALERQLENALSAIGPLEQRLSSTIGSTLRSVRFPTAVAAASARSIPFFERLVRETVPAGGAEPGSVPHGGVDQLKRNYTMAHERRVHESAVGGGDVATEDLDDGIEIFAGVEENGSVDAQTQPPPAEPELGDNVELF